MSSTRPPSLRVVLAIEVVSVGGSDAGMKTSTPVMNGSPNRAGIGEARLVTPSEPASKAKTPIARLSMGALAAFRMLTPLTSKTSLLAP
jgi:tetrahydromethanopterin S-methyltransferase subunit D